MITGNRCFPIDRKSQSRVVPIAHDLTYQKDSFGSDFLSILQTTGVSMARSHPGVERNHRGVNRVRNGTIRETISVKQK
jgi:hypothetical protein